MNGNPGDQSWNVTDATAAPLVATGATIDGSGNTTKLFTPDDANAYAIDSSANADDTTATVVTGGTTSTWN